MSSAPDHDDSTPGPGHSDTPAPPRRPRPDEGDDSDDRYFIVAEKFVGTAMIFVGFIDVLISISSGTEMAGTFPLLLYFGGLAIWAHSSIQNLTARYVVITLAIVAGLAFFHYGEVHFWHKQLIFWGTIALAGTFMFLSSKPMK